MLASCLVVLLGKTMQLLVWAIVVFFSSSPLPVVAVEDFNYVTVDPADVSPKPGSGRPAVIKDEAP